MFPLPHGLILAAIVFVVGLTGLVIRRILLCRLIGLEIMINASALAFVVAGSNWGQTDGQLMYILAISLAASESSIGLALLLAFAIVPVSPGWVVADLNIGILFYWGQTDGQVMYILAISLAAAEASIGLALLLQLHRRRQNLNIDSVSEMRG